VSPRTNPRDPENWLEKALNLRVEGSIPSRLIFSSLPSAILFVFSTTWLSRADAAGALRGQQRAPAPAEGRTPLRHGLSLSTPDAEMMQAPHRRRRPSMIVTQRRGRCRARKIQFQGWKLRSACRLRQHFACRPLLSLKEMLCPRQPYEEHFAGSAR
jgi:hypothetical protein